MSEHCLSSVYLVLYSSFSIHALLHFFCRAESSLNFTTMVCIYFRLQKGQCFFAIHSIVATIWPGDNVHTYSAPFSAV